MQVSGACSITQGGAQMGSITESGKSWAMLAEFNHAE